MGDVQKEKGKAIGCLVSSRRHLECCMLIISYFFQAHCLSAETHKVSTETPGINARVAGYDA
jgi:hypothetical protein